MGFFIFLLYPLNNYCCYIEKLLVFACLFCNESFYWILLTNSMCFQWILLRFGGHEIMLTVNNGFSLLSNNFISYVCVLLWQPEHLELCYITILFWKIFIFICKNEPFLTLHTKFNSKWIIDSNVRAKTIKFLEASIREINSLCPLARH